MVAHSDPDNSIAASISETYKESVYGASEYKLNNIQTVYHLSTIPMMFTGGIYGHGHWN